ncbi:MAG: AAA family ATPase, partial [Candidatus Thiodiazotropha sp. (ex Lucinoma kastoroae)]|nr:AAA family ATPase [Candidatus Thiodiazotropha sp. (ex Lucinoma kastoroae)]
EDLYYRISEITINIPPLRDRAGDAVLLAWSFLTKYAKQNSSKVTGFTKEALKAIEGYSWPGNVRELENIMKRSVIMADDQLITPDELQLSQDSEDSMPINLREVREQAEARAIIRAMSFVEGNVSKAADLLGVSRPTLYDLVNKYGLK